MNDCIHDDAQNSEVTVHLFCELSSVLVHLVKKWTEFSSKFTISKKELSSVHELKNELFRSFYRSFKNHFKGGMPKSASIYKSEVFYRTIFFANYWFLGEIIKNNDKKMQWNIKYAEKSWFLWLENELKFELKFPFKFTKKVN